MLLFFIIWDAVFMRGEILLLVATMLAAIGWIASKMVLDVVPPDIFIALRFLLASIILLPFCYKNILKFKRKQWLKSIVIGLFLAVSLHVWVYAVSISETLSEGAFIMSLSMIFAPITSWLLFKIRPIKSFFYALPLAMLGLSLLMLSQPWQVDSSQNIYLMASLFLSMHFVLNKKNNVAPLPSITLQLFVVGCSGLFLLCINEQPSFQINDHVVIWFAISVLISTSLRYLMQTMGQFYITMEVAALIMILEPVWTLLLSISILNEAINVQKIIGGLVILFSLFVYIKFARRLDKAIDI